MRLKYVIYDPNEHINVLYKLLIHRKYNISHVKNITEKEHKEFCLKQPYRCWYLIFNSEEPIGAFYITFENCIAINLIGDNKDFFDEILQYILSNFSPLPEVPSVIPPHFFCNINPSNKNYIESVIEYGGKLIQSSYAFKNDGQ